MSQYDLIVIGSGGAAMAAGIEARSRGKSVLLVEHGPLGGTCLNVGCVPSKNLLAAAGHLHRADVTPFPGMATGGMGDLLTGTIAAMRAQGLPAFEAACAGALLHSLAGDAAAREGQRGLLPSDLLPWLRRLANPEA